MGKVQLRKHSRCSSCCFDHFTRSLKRQFEDLKVTWSITKRAAREWACHKVSWIFRLKVRQNSSHCYNICCWELLLIKYFGAIFESNQRINSHCWCNNYMGKRLSLYNHGQCARQQLCPASSCTTPASVLALGSSGLLGDNGRCNHPLRWVDRPRYDPL